MVVLVAEIPNCHKGEAKEKHGQNANEDNSVFAVLWIEIALVFVVGTIAYLGPKRISWNTEFSSTPSTIAILTFTII